MRRGVAVSIGIGLSVVWSAPAVAQGDVPELVVTATPWASPLDELARPVTVVGRDRIVESGASTLGALLADAPGMAQSSFAGGASRPIIRGLDNARVQLLENGLGGNGVSTVSEDHAVPIDPFSATKVEVIRGPATLRYGSQAIGGVVDVINSRIPSSVPAGGIKGEVTAGYDTADRGRQAAGLVEAAAGPIVWHFDAFDRRTEDYSIPGHPSRQVMTWSNAKGVAGGASVFFDQGYAGASVSHFGSRYGIPVPDDPLDPTLIDMNQTKFQAAAEFDDLGNVFETLRLTGGYSNYHHDEVGAFSGDVGSHFDDRLWEGRAELLHGEPGSITGAFGIHALRHHLSAGGEGGELLAPTDTTMLAMFLFEEMPLARALKLQLGARAERVVVNGGALDEATLAINRVERSFVPLSGSAGVVWTPGGDWVVGATAQLSQRAPEAAELFSKGPHEATGTFEIGDPMLGKETAFSTELSLRREGKRSSFEVAVYQTRFRDYILKALTGETCDDSYDSCTNVPGGVGDELDQLRFSARGATFRGIEIGGRRALAEAGEGVIGVDGLFDFVRATLDEGGNVPRTPPMRIGAGVYYEADRLAARLGFLHAFSQKRLGPGETETAGYTRVNAELRYRPSRSLTGGTAVEFALIGDNLLNDDIRNHVSFKKDGMLLPGRSLRFVVLARF